jgi:uncharacterized membrane protein
LRLTDPARALAAAALWSLFALVLLWHGWLAPPRSAPPALIATLSALPLVPALVLWWLRPRIGLIFGALIGLGYFAHGLTEALVEPAVRWLGATEAALVVLLIGALGAATRRERRERCARPGA